MAFKRESTDAPVATIADDRPFRTHRVASGMPEALPPADPRLIVVQAAQIIVLLVANVVQRPARRLNALPPRRHFVSSNFFAARERIGVARTSAIRESTGFHGLRFERRVHLRFSSGIRWG